MAAEKSIEAVSEEDRNYARFFRFLTESGIPFYCLNGNRGVVLMEEDSVGKFKEQVRGKGIKFHEGINIYVEGNFHHNVYSVFI